MREDRGHTFFCNLVRCLFNYRTRHSQYGRDRHHKTSDAFRTYLGVAGVGGYRGAAGVCGYRGAAGVCGRNRSLQYVKDEELDRGEFEDANIPQPGCYPQYTAPAMSNARLKRVPK